jgi:hypothetical protein
LLYIPPLLGVVVQVGLWGRCGGLDTSNTSRAFTQLCCPLETVCSKYDEGFWQVGAGRARQGKVGRRAGRTPPVHGWAGQSL